MNLISYDLLERQINLHSALHKHLIHSTNDKEKHPLNHPSWWTLSSVIPIWARWAVRPCLRRIWTTGNKKNRVIQTTNTFSSSSWMTWKTSTELNSLSIRSFFRVDQTFWKTCCSKLFLLLLLSEYEGSTCSGRRTSRVIFLITFKGKLFIQSDTSVSFDKSSFVNNKFVYLQDC